MYKVSIVGHNSFIASNWLRTNPENFISINRNELESNNHFFSAVVVNFAISPNFKFERYSEKNDLDLKVGRLSADSGAHFVMLSTRKVYRQSEELSCLTEASPLEPNDYYGENKLESERRITSLLGDRCTILRMSNVYGYELGRRSFFGLAMSRLYTERKIVLDVSPFVERDFISVEEVGSLLTQICFAPCPGIYNLGSGFSLPLGRIAQWLIQGFGQGNLEIVDLAERDSFVMDNRKLLNKLDIGPLNNSFESHIKDLGLQLKNE